MIPITNNTGSLMENLGSRVSPPYKLRYWAIGLVVRPGGEGKVGNAGNGKLNSSVVGK